MGVRAFVKTALALGYKHRATIETAVGIGLIAFGTGKIISKAREACELADELSVMNNKIHVKDENNDWVDKKERNSAVMHMVGHAVKGYGKTYGLAIGAQVAGTGLVILSDVTQANQIATVSTLLASTSATLSTVKERVIADQGEEKWQEYLLGPQCTTVDVMPDGTVIQTTEPINDPSSENGFPPHCFFFDEANINWEKDARYNRDFLETHLRYLNERLWAEGFLFENDIRRDIGAPITKSGWTSGIFAEDKDGNRNYISFGLDAKNERAQAFRDGIEPTILIQLNVEDNILEQIKLPLI